MEDSDDIIILVNTDGSLQMVYSDDLAELFADDADLHTSRASHVEPYGTGWAADMSPVGGPLLLDVVYVSESGRFVEAPFKTRAAALGAEVAWLRAAMAQRTLRAQ